MSGFIVTYSQHPDRQGRREPSSLLGWVTVNGRTGETKMCVWLLPDTHTAKELLPVLAPEQEICESSALGVCAAGKGPAKHSQQEASVPKRRCCRAAAVRGSAKRNLGMLINPPLGRYLLGKCLTFICTSAVNKEAFTFPPVQQSRRVGGYCDHTARRTGVLSLLWASWVKRGKNS